MRSRREGERVSRGAAGVAVRRAKRTLEVRRQRDPRAREHPEPRPPAAQQSESRLDHRFVSTTADRLAGAFRTPTFLDMHSIVFGELAHRGAKDGRRGDAEAAQREALHVRAELVQPGYVAVAAEPGIRALEYRLHALRADATGDADRAVLPRQVCEERGGLIHDARACGDRPDLRRSHMGAGAPKIVEVESRV